MGANAQAILIYSLDGYMSAQFLTFNVQEQTGGSLRQDSCGPQDQAFMAYSGEYHVEYNEEMGESIVGHHAKITNLPHLSGTTQKRVFKITQEEDGRRMLSLRSTTPLQFSGEGRIIEVVFERLQDHVVVN